VLAAIRDKRQGKEGRYGPKSVPEVIWPAPIRVATPAEGGDGRSLPREAVHARD